MTTKGRLAAIFVTLMFFGCKGPVQTSAASASESTGVASPVGGASGDSSAGATRVEYITDPTLNNMKVMPIQIPATWRFRGVLVPKGPCTDDVSEVFRATSPDGRSFAEVMPRVGWKWGNVPGFTAAAQAACLPISGPMSAQEFLKYFSATLKVEYVSDIPVPGQAGPRQTPAGMFSTARARVRFKNGTLGMKGILTVGMYCRQAGGMGRQTSPNWAQGPATPQNARSTTGGGSCSAIVSYMAAPESQFDKNLQIWSAPGMGRQKELDPWVAAFSRRYNDQVQAETRQFDDESNAAFAARQQGYKDAAAVQQQMHNEFLQTMQEGTDRSMANAARIANSNHTMASDMVDYSLDRQTVVDVNTGETGKISNQVTPGGSLQRVHGDGTPIQ